MLTPNMPIPDTPTLTIDPATMPVSARLARQAAETTAYRALSDVIHLWSMCAKSACRHARACRGDPYDCLARYAPLVPEDVRDGAKAMVEGWMLGLPFEAVHEDAPDEIEAYDAWITAVQDSAR